MADSFGQQLRSPIMHAPTEEGLDYEDVTFPSLDGVPLEGWFIPAPVPGAASPDLSAGTPLPPQLWPKKRLAFTVAA